MNITVTGKNYSPSDKLKDTIEKKFAKLDKYFPDEVRGHVLVAKEKDGYKTEATINADTIFRAEMKSGDPYDGVDRVIEKLSRQMSKFKTKLQRKHKGAKNYGFDSLPDIDDEQEEIEVVKSKKFQLEPMTHEEAIMQMEMLGHEFFVYLNMETDSVNVVYKRKDGNYGVLETTY